MGEKVRVFVVLVHDKGEPKPKVYHESLTAPAARQIARHLAMAGQRSSVIRFDISATVIASMRYGSSSISVARRKAQ